MDNPLASIVVPVGPDSEALGECLGSIARQDYPKKEVILVCDPSTANLPSLPRGSEDLRVIRERSASNLAHMINVGMRAARGHVKILLMPYCIPLGAQWLAGMVGPLADEEVGAVVSRCRMENGKSMGLAPRLLDAVDPLERRTREKGPRRQDVVSYICDAYRAGLLADVGYFDEDRLSSPGEAVDMSLKVADAGFRVLLSGQAMAVCKVPGSNRNVRGVLTKALDYGYADAVLDKLYSLRWLNAGVFAAAALSLLLLPLAAVDMRPALVLSAGIFAWGWFLGPRLPRLGWECPAGFLNFGLYASVVLLIRDDWWPGLFGRGLHPATIRRWCWLGSVTASYVALAGWAGLRSAARACRRPGGALYALPILPLATLWWLLAGVGYAVGQVFGSAQKD